MAKPVDFLSSDLFSVRVDFNGLTIKGSKKTTNRNYWVDCDLSGHPLSSRICEYLIIHGPAWPAGTIFGYCNAFVSLLKFFQDSSYMTLNAEALGSYTDWLRTTANSTGSVKYGEGTRKVYGNRVLLFMEWLAEVGEIRIKEVITARVRHLKAHRGFSARQFELLRLNAISPEDYVRLLKAIRLEYEQCKALLSCSRPEQDGYETAFPLLPFSMLLGMQLGIRSVEFNYLKMSDLRNDRLLLNPPNKKPSEVLLTPSLMASLELAECWMSRYRLIGSSEDPLLVYPIEKGTRAKEVVRFDTSLLNWSLKKFYAKYFARKDAGGVPYLFATADDSEKRIRPFYLSFNNFRKAAITEAARHERNPKTLMRFARHSNFATTLRYYAIETHRRWVSNVSMYLAPSAELLRMVLENQVAQPTDEAVANAANAAVPGGHCEQALSGDRSCRRASDCRLCTFFRIHPSKREFFVKQRADALESAQELQTDQGLIREAENLREFAALNEAIIQRIDDFVADPMPHG